MDFFPLTIEYEERFYASGRISGSRFVKREGRPRDEAILSGRLIDRPIRPLFPKGYHNEVQAVGMVLSYDPDVQTDIIAMIAISAALKISGIPFDGPVGGSRIGLIDGKLVPMPTGDQLNVSELDLTVAGTSDAIMMVEAGAKQVSEEVMLEALELAHNSYQSVIKLQDELYKAVGKPQQDYQLVLPDESIELAVKKFLNGREKTIVGNQLERHNKAHELREEMVAHFEAESGNEEGFSIHAYKEAFESLVKKEVRRAIIEDGKTTRRSSQ